MICDGLKDKSYINTDTYFDQVCKENIRKERMKKESVNKNKNKNKKKNYLKKLKKKKSGKKNKILDIDCRICFHHKVYDVNPVVYCSG